MTMTTNPMLIDYTDKTIQDELIDEFRTTMLDHVRTQLDDLPDAMLANIRFSDALSDIVEYIENNLVIEFKS